MAGRPKKQKTINFRVYVNASVYEHLHKQSKIKNVGASTLLMDMLKDVKDISFEEIPSSCKFDKVIYCRATQETLTELKQNIFKLAHCRDEVNKLFYYFSNVALEQKFCISNKQAKQRRQQIFEEIQSLIECLKK